MADTSVVVANIHPGEVGAAFHSSMINMLLEDASTDGMIVPNGGQLSAYCGSGRIPEGRNEITESFLATGCEWLLWIDADMGFSPDTARRLVEAADPDERPVVGGLCFGQRLLHRDHKTGAATHETFPTIYRFLEYEDQAGFVCIDDYPRDRLTQVAGTGAALLLIHRSILQKIHENSGPEWFTPIRHKNGTLFSEDLSFCVRVALAGSPIYVHTGVKTSHEGKTAFLTEDLFDAEQQARRRIGTYVVIPMKNRVDLTGPLLEQLKAQGGYDAIFVMDNGSNRKNRNRLDQIDGIEVFDCEGMGIHDMWNLGLDEANRRSERSNVAILNNDLRIGPAFLDGLAGALRADARLNVVCPNYDGRSGRGLQYVTDICAGRYDGTGGLAGFAFMLRGESGYRFPSELRWYAGDNHLVASTVMAGNRAAIVLDVDVEHVDGGSQTGDWADPDMKKVLDGDMAWFADWLAASNGRQKVDA